MGKNKYNVYSKDELVREDIDFHGLQKFFKYNSIELKQVIDSGEPVIDGYYIEKIGIYAPVERFGAENLKEWDKVIIAAELIRTGQGKIETVMVDGKPRKVTVPR